MTSRVRGGGPSVAQSVAWFAASNVLALIGYLSINAIAGRFLGPDEFGRFVVIYTASVAVMQVGLLGVHRSGLREAARVRTADDPLLAELRQGIGVVTRVTIPACGVVSGVVTWFMVGGSDLERVVIALAVAALVVLSSHQTLWANYLRGFGYVRFAGLLEGRAGGGIVSLLQAGLLLAVATLFPKSGVAGALIALAVGYLLPVLWAARRVGRRWRHVPSPRTRLSGMAAVAGRNWRFMIIQLSLSVSQNTEVWIAAFVLTAYDTSMFGAAQRLAVVIAFPLIAIQVVFSPVVSRLWGDGDVIHLQRVLRTGATFAVGLAVVVSLPMVIAPGWVLDLVFGEPFSDGAVVLAMFAVAHLANAVTGLCGATLSMTHHEGAAALIMTVDLVVRLCLGVALALAFGLGGLAISVAVIGIGLNSALWVATLRLVGVNTLPTLRPSLALLRRTAG